MANTFKILTQDDISVIETPLYESIPLTGTLFSGTYDSAASTSPGSNILNFSHGYFQSVYDYPYLSSSANHLLDITLGYASSSVFSVAANVQNTTKIAIYNSFAQKLVGYDVTGSIQLFDEDGDLTSGNKMRECIFLNFSRLLYKEEIKKGSFNMTIYTGNSWSAIGGPLVINDAHATGSYLINSPAGEYSFLTCSSPTGARTKVGLIFYQAGVVVLTASIFTSSAADNGSPFSFYSVSTPGLQSINQALTGSSISGSADAFRRRLKEINFNSTTKLQSMMIFCPIGHNEFNYSSNPTYLSGSRIVVKNIASDQPVTYITAIGLYSPDNELLAVGKISEPVRKSNSVSMILRGRIDF